MISMKFCHYCKVVLPLALFIGLTFWLAYQFVEPPPPNTVHIAAGREGSAYYQFAEKYKQALAKSGVELVIHATAGTLRSLALLHKGKAQLALIQSGVSQASPLKFEQAPQALAALSYEPMWVFHNADLQINYLFELKGKRLIIGEQGSGTQALARRLLAHNGIDANNSTLLNMPDEAAIKALNNNQADAVFLVSAIQSKTVQQLLYQKGVKLLSFRRAAAYAQAYPHLSQISLPEGVVNLLNRSKLPDGVRQIDLNVPKEDKHLIATTATLIASADLNAMVVRLLLREARKIHQNQFNYDQKIKFPQACCSELVFNAAASRYLENGDSWIEGVLPFWLATLIDRLLIMLLPLLTIIPIAFKIFPSLYHYRIRYRIYRWYDRLMQLDIKIQTILANNAQNQSKMLEAIEQELLTIEAKANQTTNVPLSYMGEFYNLRTHMNLVLDRLKVYKAQIKSSGSTYE